MAKNLSLPRGGYMIWSKANLENLFCSRISFIEDREFLILSPIDLQLQMINTIFKKIIRKLIFP
jgi:hypothetical protein